MRDREIECNEYRNKERNARFDIRVESCEGYGEKRSVMLLKRRNRGSLGVVDFLPFLANREGTPLSTTKEGSMRGPSKSSLISLISSPVFNSSIPTSAATSFYYMQPGALNAGTRCNW